MTQSSREATIGEVIQVVDKDGQPSFFGMTAGHFVRQDSHEPCEDETNIDSDDKFYQEPFELDLTSIDANIEEMDETFRIRADENIGRIERAEVSDPSLKDGRNLDWALIRIYNRNYAMLPNTYRGEYIFGVGHGALDFLETDVVMQFLFHLQSTNQ